MKTNHSSPSEMPTIGTSLLRVQRGLLTEAKEVLNGIREIDPERTLATTLERLDALDLTPLITGSKLRDPIQLLLTISDDISTLKLARILNPPTHEELMMGTLVQNLETEVLAVVPEPTLLFSLHDINKYAVNELAREQLGQLFSLGRRLSAYRDVLISWDQAIDRRVWTTNIDTVNFIRALASDGVMLREDIKQAVEIGVGGGGISKTLVQYLPRLHQMLCTDISPYALMCARRNIQPILKEHKELLLYLGKGLRDLDVQTDLLVVNPPYVPHKQKPDAVDPYRGTGLIREVLELSRSKLNKSNPDACVYLGMSSLAEKDFAAYQEEFPQYSVTEVGQRRKVPLKILSISENRDWIQFLIDEHGLIFDPELGKTAGFSYWHEIYTLKLVPS